MFINEKCFEKSKR